MFDFPNVCMYGGVEAAGYRLGLLFRLRFCMAFGVGLWLGLGWGLGGVWG